MEYLTASLWVDECHSCHSSHSSRCIYWSYFRKNIRALASSTNVSFRFMVFQLSSLYLCGNLWIYESCVFERIEIYIRALNLWITTCILGRIGIALIDEYHFQWFPSSIVSINYGNLCFRKNWKNLNIFYFVWVWLSNVFETKIGIEDPLDHIDLCHFVVFDWYISELWKFE